MSRYVKKYLDPRDWEAVYAAEGLAGAGKPPPGARTDLGGMGNRSNQQLPVPAMIFGAAVERPEHKAERERRLRLARLMSKFGLDERPWPWRI